MSAGPWETEAEIRDATGQRDWEPGEHGWRNETALLTALTDAGVELGAYDQRILEWLAGWEPQTVAVVASWVMRANSVDVEAAPVRRATYTCVYKDCSGESHRLDPAAAERWMDEHAREVAHDSRWPVCFRIDYPDHSMPGVAFRAAVKPIAGGVS